MADCESDRARGMQNTAFWRVMVLLALVHSMSFSQTSPVLTQHNDNYRTGAVLTETQLRLDNVTPKSFGRLTSWSVDGEIYAQPLYVPSVAIPGGPPRNVIYVATMKNAVYAFDADAVGNNGELLWPPIHLGNPVPFDFMPMDPHVGGLTLGHNIDKWIGITSTPVIDASTSCMYVTAKTKDGEDLYSYTLHSLDIRSGRPCHSPAKIEGCVPSPGGKEVCFNAKMHLQRASLLLSNGIVYMGFASHQDTDPFHGWLFAYDSFTLAKVAVFCTSPSSEMKGRAGIWQAGGGPAADQDGNVFVITGNGEVSAPRNGPDFGNAFLKLSTQLAVTDWFTPANFAALNLGDLDLGSAGPLLLEKPNVLIGGGKQGILYVVDAGNMGHLQPQTAAGPVIPPPVQQFRAATKRRRFPFFAPLGFAHIHGSPVTWASTKGQLVYLWPESDHLKAFLFDPASRRFTRTTPIFRSHRKAPTGMPGGILSVSANGDRDGTGIVWASLPLKGDAFIKVVPGVLRAFDAATLTEIWNSEKESEFMFAKYCPPTIANGKVYLATFSDRLDVYGLLPKTKLSKK
jgi:outer membrane protein assembly factor BamB